MILPATLPASRLTEYQADLFALRPQDTVRDVQAAIRFVNQRGFVYFWPIKGITFPSLWAAVAGARPVPSAHDDPGHITWGWKDEMLDKRVWYYAKILRGRATMISLAMAPPFYALSANYGDPEQDYLESYREGTLSQAGKSIYEALLREGPLDTVTLRRTIRMTSKESNSPFERGMTGLQQDFKILPVGVARTGAWRYSFIYELVHRHYPELPIQAQALGRGEARQALLARYFQSVGAATTQEAARLFGWPMPDLLATLQALQASGTVRGEVTLEGARGSHWVAQPLWPYLV